MMRTSGFLLLLAFCALCCAVTSTAADRFDGLDAYVAEAMEKWQVPGLAIAVVKDDELVLARGYGTRQVGSQRRVTKDTVFSIASCTKSFTAACIGMLVDEKKVRWDDHVQAHYPAFRVADAYVSQEATLRDLLCHRTGLVHGDLLFVKGDFGNEEVLRRLQFLPQAEPFRTKLTYNNLMYEVVGQVVREKSGISWEKFVQVRIIEPLDMNSTFITRDRVPAERLAVRHRPYDGVIQPVKNPFPEYVAAPSGAIHSTVVDMAKWLKLQLHDGEYHGRRLIEAETLREMHALVHSIPIRRNPAANAYQKQVVGTGLGWFVSDYRGRLVVSHGGGWGADMALMPEEKLAVVVLSNLDWNLLAQMLSYDVIDAYLVGSERAWSKENKWDFWLERGGPQAIFRTRDEQKAELEKNRVLSTKPSQPLEACAGRYESDLYGSLDVTLDGHQLCVRFGNFTGELNHWQDDMFYGRAIVEPFIDWLVKFRVVNDAAAELEIVHIGWRDPDEKHIFRRAK